MSTYGTTDKVPGLNFCYLTSFPEGCDTDADLQYSDGSKMAWKGTTVDLNGMCNGSCHTYKLLERDPYLGPKVLTTKADPDPGPPDGATNVVLTAFVFDHDDDVTSVTIDLTDIDGGSETMYDDGDTTNHGDEVAGDSIYSCITAVAGTTAPGLYSLPVEATDADGDGEGELILEVFDPDERIIDNDDPEASYVGTWPSFSNANAYDGDAQYHTSGTGANTATWTPDLPTTGSYNVYAWWVAYTNRATDAPYTINYDGGSETIYVNQQVNGGQWNLLGTYPFAAGTSGSVVLTDDANGVVIADAVKWNMP
jgi:hypothetical protein